MTCLTPMARLAAAAIALIAWAGLGIQLQASTELMGSAGAALWAMLRFFTVLANLLVALLFTGIALGWRRTGGPFLLGGVTLAILLVGIVYGLLLNGLLALSGGAALADVLLHKVTPVLVPLWWLAFAPKGGLQGPPSTALGAAAIGLFRLCAAARRRRRTLSLSVHGRRPAGLGPDAAQRPADGRGIPACRLPAAAPRPRAGPQVSPR